MQAVVNGVGIYCEVQGEGPAVIVHGLGGTSNVWHAQRAALSKYYKVVACDLSGSGRSDRDGREYSIEKWAEELAGLLDASALSRAVLVGHSMATLIVQRFTLKDPERV